jgi:S1-C subfamily serine protease
MGSVTIAAMVDIPPSQLSDALADVVERAAPWVVQVQGRSRPASAVIFGPDLVLTTARALGQEEGLRVAANDGRVLDAEVAGWDPATQLVLLRVGSLGAQAALPSDRPGRVGHLVLALARSWSNVITASSGIVSVVGGPLPTGPGRSIERVIRTNAPMHSGFAGGPLVGADGAVVGISTAVTIRGFAVAIPVDIAWPVAARLAEHGTVERGYLGLAAQPVRLSAVQLGQEPGDRGLLIIAVTAGSPAEAAGLLVGDIVVRCDDDPLRSTVDLLERLGRHGVGDSIRLRVLRGDVARDIAVSIAPMPNRRP